MIVSLKGLAECFLAVALAHAGTALDDVRAGYSLAGEPVATHATTHNLSQAFADGTPVLGQSSPAAATAKPTVSNFTISPKEIGTDTKVTIAFDYSNVEGGLSKGKVLLIQKIQIPGDPAIERTSNWQSQLADLGELMARSGRFERTFVNTETWRGPKIDLVYRLKIVDGRGRESNAAETTITPR